MGERNGEAEIYRNLGEAEADTQLLRWIVSIVVFALCCWWAVNAMSGAPFWSSVAFGGAAIYGAGLVAVSRPGYRVAAFLKELPYLIGVAIVSTQGLIQSKTFTGLSPAVHNSTIAFLLAVGVTFVLQAAAAFFKRKANDALSKRLPKSP
ncbi:MAG TPA: hypothetical protein VGZ02_08020 [Candidatus Baltobacteraceae bacterium]|jgi:uncharacterized membrane protein|nr:hypothetical protein [Candidatus Baltobacteraceae bacterium]